MKTILVDDELIAMEEFARCSSTMAEIEIVGKFNDPLKALEYTENNTVDFALLDIEMPVMSGLELGKRLKQIRPDMILIYLTGYSKYAAEVLKMKADYFLTKPYNKDDIIDAVSRAILLSKRQNKRMVVHTFGRFDVFVDDKVIHFSNAKGKELFALCIDHNGGEVTMEEAIDKLWPDREYDDKVKKLYRKAIMSIQTIMKDINMNNIFSNSRATCRINKESITCDYYMYLEDKIKNKELFNGEYMFDYEWSEEKVALLTIEDI